jgi:hypothetical protein
MAAGGGTVSLLVLIPPRPMVAWLSLPAHAFYCAMGQ